MVVVSSILHAAQPHTDHGRVHVGRVVSSLNQPSNGGLPSGGEFCLHILVHDARVALRGGGSKASRVPGVGSTALRYLQMLPAQQLTDL